MKKKLLSILLCLVMALSLLPTTALAANATSVTVGTVTLSSGNYATTDNSGNVTKVTDGSTPTDHYVKFENGVLTLKGATITMSSYSEAINSSGDLTLVLSGTNTVTSHNERGIKIYGNLTIKKQSSDDDSLTVTAHSDGIYTYYGNLTIESGTVTSTASSKDNGLAAVEGSITIEGGSVTATGEGAGIYAQNGITITGGTVTGTVTGASGAYGIQGGQYTANLTVSGSSVVTGVVASGASNSAKAIFWENTAACSITDHAVYAGTGSGNAPLVASPDVDTYKSHYVHLAPAVMLVDLDGAGDTPAVSYTDFATGWNAALGNSNTANTTVKLLADWTATNGSFGTGDGFGPDNAGYICVRENKTVSLDLGGCDIDRGLTTDMDYGCVIVNAGTLIINDTSTPSVEDQGKITGGYNSNVNYSAGGIFASSGALTLNGGQITGNKAINAGGGVYIISGTFTMNGGKISGNIANYNSDNVGGAGGVHTRDSFIMTGGEISGNHTCGLTYGGGVGMLPNIGTVTVSGTAKITGNKSGATFSGDYATGGSADNVYLPAGKSIAVSAALTNGASIGVTTATIPTSISPVAITGNNSADYSSYFHSDNTAYTVENSGSDANQVARLTAAPPSSENSITAFRIDGAVGTIDEAGHTVAVTVPYGTDVTSLTPSITHNGASVAPAGAQNFTDPVTYTVTAENGGTQDYIVTVTVASAPPSDPYIPPALVTEIKSEGSVTGSNIDSLVSGGKELTVTGGDGAGLVFSTDALKGISGQTSGSVTVKIEDVSKEHQDTHAGKTVYSLTVTSGGKTVSDFGGSVTVSLPYELKTGEKAGDVTVWYLAADGSMSEIPCTYDVKTKLATFTVTHFSEYVVGVKDWVNPFDDVAEADWFYGDVAFVNAAGLMEGTGETTFSPEMTTTRGMIVTVLYRLEGESAVQGTCPFDDVEAGKYYEKAIIWAAANGIVDGYGDGKFGPEDNITREQMATILWRYAKYKDYDVSASADLSKFSDAGSISGYALSAMQWANASGLVDGKGSGILDPLGSAKRCEAAAILHRFCEKAVQ